MEQFNLPLTIKVFREGTAKSVPYVAFCPELDLSAAGKTAEKARHALVGIIDDVLAEKAKKGTLRDYLEEFGLDTGPTSSRWEPAELSFIQVPLKLARV